MEGIKGLDNNECVHLQGDVEMEVKCRKMCICVCVCELLFHSIADYWSQSWLTLLFVVRNTCIFLPT